MKLEPDEAMRVFCEAIARETRGRVTVLDVSTSDMSTAMIWRLARGQACFEINVPLRTIVRTGGVEGMYAAILRYVLPRVLAWYPSFRIGSRKSLAPERARFRRPARNVSRVR